LKQRIAIVLLGLFLGLAARVAVETYHHFSRQTAPQPAGKAPVATSKQKDAPQARTPK
jgi:hypothetical protein